MQANTFFKTAPIAAIQGFLPIKLNAAAMALSSLRTRQNQQYLLTHGCAYLLKKRQI